MPRVRTAASIANSSMCLRACREQQPAREDSEQINKAGQRQPAACTGSTTCNGWPARNSRPTAALLCNCPQCWRPARPANLDFQMQPGCKGIRPHLFQCATPMSCAVLATNSPCNHNLAVHARQLPYRQARLRQLAFSGDRRPALSTSIACAPIAVAVGTFPAACRS